jgi:hypothetical protein
LTDEHYSNAGQVKIGFVSDDLDESYRLSINRCWVSSTYGATAREISDAVYARVSSDMGSIVSSTTGLTYTVSNELDVNVHSWNDTAVVSEATAGCPVTTVKVGTGTGEINVASGKVPATIAVGDLAASSVTASSLATDAVSEIVDGIWDELASGHVVTGTYGAYLNYPVTAAVISGSGNLQCTYTMTLSDNGLPVANAKILVSTDSSCQNVVASSITDQFGVAYFNLDAGTVYLWRYKSGVNFSNPINATFSSAQLNAYGTGTLVSKVTTSRTRNATYVGSS